MAIDTDRAALHALVDAIPDERLIEAKAVIKLLTIPEDDEPVSDEERASLDATHEAHLRGELIPHEVAMRDLGSPRSARAPLRDNENVTVRLTVSQCT